MKVKGLLSCLGLFIASAGLISIFAWGLVRFASPRQLQVSVGQVQDFPAGQAPRLFARENQAFYVVNVEGELIALAARSEDHLVRCLVRWWADYDAFIDPCLGTNFSVRGEYRGKGPPGTLRHLPLQVRDSQVWVDLGYR